jgi:hypothetical protein
MGAGAVFILLVVIVILVGHGFAFWALRAGLWAKETSPRGDDVEPGAEATGGGRPEHTRVDDPGDQTFVGR